MKHIDITIDFETCGLTPDAAPLSIGAVAWNRFGEDTPFINDDDNNPVAPFYEHIDLRSAFLDGFAFDQSTSEWWSRQSPEAKAEVLKANDYDIPLHSVKETILDLCEWIDDVKERTGAQTVNLWSQGTDFDISILRHICTKYGIKFPVGYRDVRDHRSVTLELGCLHWVKTNDEPLPSYSDIYSLVKDYREEGSCAHNPVFDCRRSIFTTWQFMKLL